MRQYLRGITRLGYVLISLLLLAVFPGVSSPQGVGEDPPFDLMSISDILEMPASEVVMRRRVETHGRVYFHDPENGFAIIGQGNHLICIKGVQSSLNRGDLIRVRGKTRRTFQHNTAIRVETVQLLKSDSPKSLFSPRELNFDEVRLDHHDCGWVTTEAVVKAAQLSRDLTAVFVCQQESTKFLVCCPFLPDEKFARDLIGSRIRLTGNLRSTGEDGKRLKNRIMCPREQIQVLEAATTAPAAIADRTKTTAISIESPTVSSEKDLEYIATGQITLVTSKGFFIQTTKSGRYISNIHQLPLVPGTIVDIHGRRPQQSGRAAAAALVYIRRFLELPAPVDAEDIPDLNQKHLLNRRVAFRGIIQAVEKVGDSVRLHVDSKAGKFRASILSTPHDYNIDVGSHVEMIGVLIKKPTYRNAFLVYVATEEDIIVTRKPGRFRLLDLAAVFSIALALLVTGVTGAKSLRSNRGEQHNTTNVPARLTQSLESIQDGILIVDQNQTVLFANQMFCEQLRINVGAGDSSDDVRSQIVGRVSNGDFLTEWDRLKTSPNDRFEITVRLPLEENGIVSSLEVFSSPVNDKRGETVARLWTFHDITEKEQLQESLLTAKKQEAIGRLVSGFAHDFNNLLTGIQGNLFVVQLDPSKCVGDFKDNLSAASNASKRATTLVAKLLGFSRKTRLEFGVVKINDLVHRMMQLAGPSQIPDGVWKLELGDKLPKVKLDEAQVEQVVLNLLLNAVDAIRYGGEMNIRTYATDVSRDGRPYEQFVVLSVSDTGVGMSPTTLSQIFEPFFTTKHGEGTGLGLAMCEGIVQQHGGWIECDSEEGTGSEFRVFLPTNVDETQEDQPTITVPSDFFTDRKILVVDDEELIRSTSASMLRSRGAVVHTAEDGQSALEFLAKRSDIDLILLDWLMPGTNGSEVLRDIRIRNPDITTFICTGCAYDIGDIARIANVSPDAVIQKPFEPDDIAEKLGLTWKPFDSNAPLRLQQPDTTTPRKKLA